MKTRSRIAIVLALVISPFALFGLSEKTRADALPFLAATPNPTQTPKLTRERTAATTPSPTPTPATVATPSPTPSSTQTLDSLQTKIRQRIMTPEVRRGRVGIKIVSLNSGKVVFENESEKYYTPASNMKNFTIAAALETLGPDFKFKTRVLGPKPDSSGTVKADLRIEGGGDITISTAFFGTSPSDPETYFKGIDRLVDQISAAGVKRIEGDLVGDERYFKGFTIPETWEWDDLQTKDGAGISALPINDNAVDISVKPGASAGSPCIVVISPPNTVFKIVNECSTSSAGSKGQLKVNKQLNKNEVRVSGSISSDDKGFAGILAVSHPADLFLAILKDRLAKRGIVVTGQTTTVRNPDFHNEITRPGTWNSYPANKPELVPVELARLESPPLSLIAAKTMKPSQNMYTETILWALGEASVPSDIGMMIKTDPPYTPQPERPNSSDLGLAVAKKFRDTVGIPSDAVIQYDGSGMSRHDVITPAAVVQLYTYMAKQSRYVQVWRDSLSIGGVDGTLRNRFKGTAASGNMRGKTGTLDQVSALSGYVKTASGEELIVSIIVNGVPKTADRTGLADDIVVALANYNGKID